MKKKLIAGLLCVGMSFSLLACGSNDTNTENTSEQGTEVVSGSDTEDNTQEEVVDTETEAGTETTDNVSSGVDDLGQALRDSFVTLTTESPDASATDIAEGLLANDYILFSGATMEVEPGYLTGFDNAEITGFEEGTMFAPMIGSIPFVGYVFTLADDADAESFQTLLLENANPNWNICTMADETIAEVNGNKVFFVMCPLTLDEE
jgi:hypothetical protein